MMALPMMRPGSGSTKATGAFSTQDAVCIKKTLLKCAREAGLEDSTAPPSTCSPPDSEIRSPASTCGKGKFLLQPSPSPSQSPTAGTDLDNFFPLSPTSAPGSPTSSPTSRRLVAESSPTKSATAKHSSRLDRVLPILSADSSPFLRQVSAPPSATAVSKEAIMPALVASEGKGKRSSVMATVDTGSRCTPDDFNILKTLGVGFMGSVRLVKLSSGVDPTPFALKVMKKRQVIKHKQVVHVMQEVELLRQVRHTFIVRFLTAFQDDAHLFMCMEYLSGGELFGLIKRKRKISINIACFYAGEVVLALRHLHSFDIVYRDLKPENILIDSAGHAKIADLGFAKVVRTRTWTTCGTPEYMAPEIVSQKGHGKPVDWWALGVLTYEMVTGKAPFKSSSRSELYQKVLKSEPSFNFKHSVRSFIVDLLQKDSSRRLGSGAGGASEVQGHPWFASVDWDVLEKRKYRPPIAPELAGPDDTSMFDDYPEEPLSAGVGNQISDEEQELFRDY